MNNLLNLMSLNRSAMAGFLHTLDEPPSRARTIIQWIHQKRTLDVVEMLSLNQRLRGKLTELTMIVPPVIMHEQRAADGTIKWLLKLGDGNAIETVYIPEPDRGTLCISSQVGCGLNCRFCATAQAGFNRNLTTAEIIGQLWWAWSRVPKITNVVMMGMGEPLLNYEAVISALDLMLDDCAYGLSKYRVTVSTAGLVPAMERLRRDSPVSLAVSLHAPNNALRSQLVPLNKKYPLEVLMPVCREYFPPRSKQTVLFEYVMLAGVNDQPEHARELAQLLSGMRCKVNLIPFNPFPGTIYQCSDAQTIAEFQNYLIRSGIPAWVRRTRGDDIDGACGQLAGQFTDRTGRKKPHALE
jgi:23S rRNA (adenine2503-C2)-methyltransferase